MATEPLRRRCWLVGCSVGIHSIPNRVPPFFLEPAGLRPGSIDGLGGGRGPIQKKARLPDERPRPGWINVGDPALFLEWALALGGCVEDPRLGEGGDHKPPRRRAFPGVDDVGDELGEREAPFRSGAGGGGSGGVGFGIRVDLLGDGVVEGAEVHRVGRLHSKVVLHQPKHRKVEGLGEV